MSLSNLTSATTNEFNSPIMRQKLSDQIFERLKNMIISNEFPPGDAMPSERELMEYFSVGRPAVREALQALANKGLITITHGERSKVNKLNVNMAFQQVDDIAKMLLSNESSNLEYLKALRKIMEVGTIRIAAEKCTKADIVDLRTLLDEQHKHINKPKVFIKTDMSFHVRIAKITENPLLQAVIQAMLKWMHQFYRPLLHCSGGEEITLQEHKKIIDCLEKNDGIGAEKMIGEHISRANPLYSYYDK